MPINWSVWGSDAKIIAINAFLSYCGRTGDIPIMNFQSIEIVRRESSGWTSSNALAPSLNGYVMLPSMTRPEI